MISIRRIKDGIQIRQSIEPDNNGKYPSLAAITDNYINPIFSFIAVSTKVDSKLAVFSAELEDYAAYLKANTTKTLLTSFKEYTRRTTSLKNKLIEMTSLIGELEKAYEPALIHATAYESFLGLAKTHLQNADFGDSCVFKAHKFNPDGSFVLGSDGQPVVASTFVVDVSNICDSIGNRSFNTLIEQHNNSNPNNQIPAGTPLIDENRKCTLFATYASQYKDRKLKHASTGQAALSAIKKYDEVKALGQKALAQNKAKLNTNVQFQPAPVINMEALAEATSNLNLPPHPSRISPTKN